MPTSLPPHHSYIMPILHCLPFLHDPLPVSTCSRVHFLNFNETTNKAFCIVSFLTFKALIYLQPVAVVALVVMFKLRRSPPWDEVYTATWPPDRAGSGGTVSQYVALHTHTLLPSPKLRRLQGKLEYAEKRHAGMLSYCQIWVLKWWLHL